MHNHAGKTNTRCSCAPQSGKLDRPFWRRGLNCCYRAGPNTAGSGLFVCLLTGPLAQAGGRTDGGSAG